jgi:ribosomal protein S19
MSKSNSEQQLFINKAIEKYGDLYGYDKVAYKSDNSPVIISCKRHGDFAVRPKYFLFGNVCPACTKELDWVKANMTPRVSISFYTYHLTTEVLKNILNQTFIEFEGKCVFDFSKIEFKGLRVPVEVKCRRHNKWFKATPVDLIKKTCGCTDCNRTHAIFPTAERFIEESSKVHNGRYEYLNVDIKKPTDKILVKCPKHGSFTVTAINHLHRGVGCKKCFVDKVAERKTDLTVSSFEKKTRKSRRDMITTEQYIEKAIAVHGDAYDYSMVEYTGSPKHISIICPEHGVFSMIAANHLRGNKCPKCRLKIKSIRFGSG